MEVAACLGLQRKVCATAPPPAASLNKERGKDTMYAIIETGGKQYKVAVGDTLFLEKLEAQDSVTFEKVLAVGKEGGTVIGSPLVAGASVKAKVIKQGKGKKITVFTYKAKKNQKRKLGHRQPYTKVEIEAING